MRGAAAGACTGGKHTVFSSLPSHLCSAQGNILLPPSPSSVVGVLFFGDTAANNVKASTYVTDLHSKEEYEVFTRSQDPTVSPDMYHLHQHTALCIISRSPQQAKRLHTSTLNPPTPTPPIRHSSRPPLTARLLAHRPTLLHPNHAGTGVDRGEYRPHERSALHPRLSSSFGPCQELHGIRSLRSLAGR